MHAWHPAQCNHHTLNQHAQERGTPSEAIALTPTPSMQGELLLLWAAAATPYRRKPRSQTSLLSSAVGTPLSMLRSLQDISCRQKGGALQPAELSLCRQSKGRHRDESSCSPPLHLPPPSHLTCCTSLSICAIISLPRRILIVTEKRRLPERSGSGPAGAIADAVKPAAKACSSWRVSASPSLTPLRAVEVALSTLPGSLLNSR
jgi:hypothetical protein